ncbi:hypothetical protein D8I24_4025 (plasmid) [Cupriavidus necator H850]|nr:hypothetical protein D8I24_4025 [Cupriavidus necator H850]
MTNGLEVAGSEDNDLVHGVHRPLQPRLFLNSIKVSMEDVDKVPHLALSQLIQGGTRDKAVPLFTVCFEREKHPIAIARHLRGMDVKRLRHLQLLWLGRRIVA